MKNSVSQGTWGLLQVVHKKNSEQTGRVSWRSQLKKKLGAGGVEGWRKHLGTSHTLHIKMERKRVKKAETVCGESTNEGGTGTGEHGSFRGRICAVSFRSLLSINTSRIVKQSAALPTYTHTHTRARFPPFCINLEPPLFALVPFVPLSSL